MVEKKRMTSESVWPLGPLPSLGSITRALGCPQSRALALMAAILLQASLCPTTGAFSVQMQDDNQLADVSDTDNYVDTGDYNEPATDGKYTSIVIYIILFELQIS